MAERVPAYEGDSPYIFISYAHKDSDSVMRVLDVMQSRGYRFWYDDGIVPGSEWPEYIAAHLDKAAVVVAFISDNSVKSSNCRREITFALSRNKPFISVFLEETELPLGLELQLSSAQSVLKHNFNTEEAFWDKLCTTPILEPCKMQPAQTDSWLTVDAASEQAPIASSEHTQDAAPDFSPISGHDSNLAASPELALNADSAADPEPAFTADSAADPEPASIADSAADLEPAPAAASGSAPAASSGSAPAASSEQAPAASSEPAPARHTDTASPASAGKPAKKNKNIKIILLAAVIAAAVLVRIVLFTSMAGDNNSNITNENGKLSVSNENVTQKTISSINRARNLDRLYFETKKALPDKIMMSYQFGSALGRYPVDGVDPSEYMDIFVADYGGRGQAYGNSTLDMCSYMSSEFARNRSLPNESSLDGFLASEYRYWMVFAVWGVNNTGGQSHWNTLNTMAQKVLGSPLKKPEYYWPETKSLETKPITW